MDLIHQQGKACLENLAENTQVLFELRKKLMKETFLREQAENQVKMLQERLHFGEQEKKSELTRVLEIANDVSSLSTIIINKEEK